MRDLARRRGKSMAEAKDLVRRFSGHSLRAGYATSAAAADVPALRIQQHTRHKSRRHGGPLRARVRQVVARAGSRACSIAHEKQQPIAA